MKAVSARLVGISIPARVPASSLWDVVGVSATCITISGFTSKSRLDWTKRVLLTVVKLPRGSM